MVVAAPSASPGAPSGASGLFWSAYTITPTFDLSLSEPASSFTPRLMSSITSPIAPEFCTTMMRSIGSGCPGESLGAFGACSITDSNALTSSAGPFSAESTISLKSAGCLPLMTRPSPST